LNLKKPDATDFYNIKDFNDNMEKIDEHKHSSSDITDFPDSNVNTMVNAKQFTTESEANAFFDTCSNIYPDHTHYKLAIGLSFAHSILGQGSFFLEGYKTNNTWGWQKVTTNDSVSSRSLSRSINNGMWNKWEYGSNPLTTILDANSNLDTVLTSGFYRLSGNTNIPVEDIVAPNKGNYNYGTMIVTRGHDTFSQIIFPYQNNYTPIIRTGTTSNTATKKFDYLDSGKLDGKSIKELFPINTLRDFIKGTLIKTSLKRASSIPWLLQIRGNSYGDLNGGAPFHTEVQGYNYTDNNGNIVGIGAYSLGKEIAFIDAFFSQDDDCLCFWFPRQTYWNGFNVIVLNVGTTASHKNVVTSITDVDKPTNITNNIRIIPINYSRKDLVFREVTVTTGAWVADTQFTSYGYNFRAALTCNGALQEHTPVVTFYPAQTLDDNIAPLVYCANGSVTIYAKTKPTANFAIPEIRLMYN
ncbi:MAG TPA: hypothetical protein DHW61_01795, partial [Lachnoclostridium phytofermentans]|nr:hypothetical protein [Lachnoclostridium phytofermentans]